MATDDVLQTLTETADEWGLWPIRQRTAEGHLEKSFQGRKYRIWKKRIVKSKEGETAKTAENRKTRAKCKEM